MKAMKKRIVVEVRGPLTKPEMVPTAHGYVGADVGDFVITYPATGDVWPIKADIFLRTYDLVDKAMDMSEVYTERPASTPLTLVKRKGEADDTSPDPGEA